VGNNKSYNKEEYISKQRIKKIGKNNPNWKGGKSRTYLDRPYKLLAKTIEQKCSLCNSTKNLCVHHIDGNHENNSLKNICILCMSCHSKLHWKIRKNGII
jgi:hypothetical protein